MWNTYSEAWPSSGNTPLHYAACGGYKEVVQELIKANARVEVHNENGHTPLMEAASAGHVEVARILLDNGAGINTHSNEFKESALTLACYKGIVVVQIFHYYWLFHLIFYCELWQVDSILDANTGKLKYAVVCILTSQKLQIRWSAQVLCETHSYIPCCDMRPSSRHLYMNEPIYWISGHLEMVKFLLEAGADQEHKTDEMHTALMEASMDGHVEVARLLLDSGAQVSLRSLLTDQIGENRSLVFLLQMQTNEDLVVKKCGLTECHLAHIM